MSAKQRDQVQDNLAAVELRLSEDEITSLDDMSILPPACEESRGHAGSGRASGIRTADAAR